MQAHRLNQKATAMGLCRGLTTEPSSFTVSLLHPYDLRLPYDHHLHQVNSSSVLGVRPERGYAGLAAGEMGGSDSASAAGALAQGTGTGGAAELVRSLIVESRLLAAVIGSQEASVGASGTVSLRMKMLASLAEVDSAARLEEEHFGSGA